MSAIGETGRRWVAWLLVEDHVNPVIRRVVRVAREGAAGVVHVHAVAASDGIGQRVQHTVVYSTGSEIVHVCVVVTNIGVIRGDIGGIGGDGYGRRKARCLPA